MKNSIPPVGTEIRFQHEDITLSRDQRTYICRIKFDESTKQWVVLPWSMSRGMLVFLNDKPEPQHTHIRISTIQPTGKGAYADPVAH